MKKIKVIALAALVVAMCFATGIQTLAADGDVNVYVTVSDGTLALVREKITVTDADGDGALTINDALYLAHEAKYSGGAAAGYGSASSDFGLSMTKLWGVENGSGYGYYVNNASPSGLLDTVSDGDTICAFVYTDTQGFSDVYCYFDTFDSQTAVGSELTLTLSCVGFDENWATVVKPVAGAKILIDGEETAFVTDENGVVKVKSDAAKTCVISASSASATLVPPACVVTFTEQNASTGDVFVVLLALTALALTALTMAVRRVSEYEK